ncbi:MAG: electron transfer flavoprotein subunit alpha/FixB family protein [Melioribacteraceae bacterium]|nr:electron transfer flavoprotein subunit alpha/FixB family protein [Melioribacteraceae bacterium]
MANKILVFIEQRNGQIKRASLEAVKAANNLAEKLSYEVTAVSVGNEVSDLDKINVQKVIHFKNNELENYSTSAYSDLVAEFAKESDAEILFFGNTALGKDLAPRVSVKLEAGIVMDVVEFNLNDGNIIASRPVYAGKALTNVKVNTQKKVFTVRPNVFSLSDEESGSAQVEIKEVSSPNLACKVVEYKKAGGKLDVAEADIIVSGGRGLKEAGNFKLIEDLAEVLGGAVGASRAVVDAGWRPHGEQVGQTGKTVSPTLYVAVGISGAIQHLAGMRSSKYIVAINKDADAPIFQIADYGITGDAFEIVPALIEELKKVKA